MIAQVKGGDTSSQYVQSYGLSSIWVGRLGSLNTFHKEGGLHIVYFKRGYAINSFMKELDST